MLSADYEYSDDSADEDYKKQDNDGNVGSIEAQKAYAMFSKLIQQTGTAPSSADEDFGQSDRDYRHRQRNDSSGHRHDAPPEPYPSSRNEESSSSSSHRKRRRSRSR